MYSELAESVEQFLVNITPQTLEGEIYK